jgi:hypothetical protein
MLKATYNVLSLQEFVCSTVFLPYVLVLLSYDKLM